MGLADDTPIQRDANSSVATPVVETKKSPAQDATKRLPEIGTKRKGATHPSAVLQTFLLDTFASDSRKDYNTKGSVNWSPGKLALVPTASITHSLRCGARAKVVTKFHPNSVATTDGPFETQVVFTPASVLSFGWDNIAAGVPATVTIHQQRLPSQRISLTLTVEAGFVARPNHAGVLHQGQNLRRKVVLELSSPIREVEIEYCFGFITVFLDGKPVLYGQTENAYATLKTFSITQNAGLAEISQLGAAASPEPKMPSFPQRLRLLEAVGAEAAGMSQMLAGQSRDAEKQIRKSYELCKEILGEDHGYTQDTSGNLAWNLNNRGKYAEAQLIFEKSLRLRRELFGEQHPLTAAGYEALAYNLNDQEMHTEAQPLFEKSLKLHQEMLGEKHPATASSHNGLAMSLNAQGKCGEAHPHYQKSLDLSRELLGEKHPDTATGYHNVAFNLNAQGKYAEAQPLNQRALDLRRELLGEQHAETATSYNDVAFNLSTQGNSTQAQLTLERAIHSYEASRLAGASGLERAILRTFNPRLLLAALRAKSDPDSAWSHAEMTLARGLLDQQASGKVNRLTAKEQAEEIQLRNELDRLQNAILPLVAQPQRAPTESQRLDELSGRRRQTEEQLAALAVRVSQREVASAETIRAALPSDAAIVFWVDITGHGTRFQEHWACVVRNSGVANWERLPGTGLKGEWTRKDTDLPAILRAALSQAKASNDTSTLIRQLYIQRLAPVTKHLVGVKRLHVVAVNEMAGIPVEALTSDYTVSYIPSGTYLARLKERAKPTGNELLAVIDPVFAGDAWRDLPGTRIEGNRIGRLFGSNSLMLADSSASEQELEKLRQSNNLQRFRYLHFATHGEGNDLQAFESSLILAQHAAAKDASQMEDQPYINGRLSATEVLKFWKLDAELVTLSACETAIGREGRGDGPLGFAQAFLYAGARSVCLSLWKVDDTATTLLMERFYQNLLGHRRGMDMKMGKAAALSEAKTWLRNLSSDETLTLITDMNKGVVRGKNQTALPVLAIPKAEDSGEKEARPFSHPKYWAAFVLIGDPD